MPLNIIRHDYLEQHAEDDRVLVVVFLRGGADGLTLVPPVGDDAYHRARPTIGVGAGDAIKLDDRYSLNQRLQPLMPWFERGELAIVHGAGTEDTTRSHFEAQDYMEHGGDAGGGWLGRYLRARGGSPGALSAVAIGTTLPESMRGAPGGAVMQSIRDFALAGDDPHITEQLSRLYARAAGPLGQSARDTLGAIERLRQLRATDATPQHGAAYPETTFGRGLSELARLIRARVGVVASTIDLHGWDTHFTQNAFIGSLMDELANGVNAFMTDLRDESDRVQLVVMTEFGRRVYENTSYGTDHGLGSVMFVLGEGIRGGITSGWSDLEYEHLLGPGDVPVEINYRDVLAPVLRAHSPHADLSRVFPGHQFANSALP